MPTQGFIVKGTTGRFAKRYFKCPMCNQRRGSIRERVDPGGLGAKWFVGCQNCEHGGESGRQYLHDLAAAIGCGPIDLLQRADEVLAERLEQPRRRSHKDSSGAHVPPTKQVNIWAGRLWNDTAARHYLTAQRGVSASVLIQAKVGLRGERLIFPMFDLLGRPVAYKTRLPRARAKLLSPKGSGSWAWPLYPWPSAASRQPLIVCAGELDALCALSRGLDACSVTLGADAWRPDWTEVIKRRAVLLCFDNGEERQASERCDSLQARGVSTRVIDLRRLGLKTPKGDLSDYLNGGGDPAALLKGRKS